MNQDELNFFKEILLKRRQEMFEDLKENKKKESIKESSGNNSYSYHIADQGSDSYEYEKSFLFNSLEGGIINEMDDALARIADGTYGTCERCNDLIGKARLEAIPYAKLCIECKAKEEEE